MVLYVSKGAQMQRKKKIGLKKGGGGDQEICSDGSINGGICAEGGEKAALMQEGWLWERYWDI